MRWPSSPSSTGSRRARRRLRCASPSPVAPSGRRCSRRSSCSVANARWNGCDALEQGSTESMVGEKRAGRVAPRVTGRVAWRVVRKGAVIALGVGALYVAITFVQVWYASRQDHAEPAEAIVVMGAAQYDGRPSPVFQARLDRAYELFQQGLAPLVITTGSKQEGD